MLANRVEDTICTYRRWGSEKRCYEKRNKRKNTADLCYVIKTLPEFHAIVDAQIGGNNRISDSRHNAELSSTQIAEEEIGRRGDS